MAGERRAFAGVAGQFVFCRRRWQETAARGQLEGSRAARSDAG